MALTDAQSALVDRVLKKIDALDSPGSNIVVDQTEVYTLMQEAARLLLREVPLRLLHGLVADGTDAVNETTYQYNLQTAGHTKIVLPTDFVRLVHIELDGWTMGRTQEDMLEDSIITYRRYLRGQETTTGDPRIFLTWCPVRYQSILTLTGATSALDEIFIGAHAYIFDTPLSATAFLAANATLTGYYLEDAINGVGDYAGLGYGASVVTPWSGVRARHDESAGTLTVITTDAVRTILTSAGGSFDNAVSQAVAQREVIDCFPASAGDEDALVTAFNYIPDTAPESIPADLVEAMLWRAGSLVSSPFDPQLSEVCRVRSQESLAPRIMRHRTAFSIRRRPMGF